MKFISAFVDKLNNFGLNANQGMMDALIYFALCLVCDVVPFLIIVDSSFIKILTLDLIRKFDRNENDSNDIENVIMMKNQDENL